MPASKLTATRAILLLGCGIISLGSGSCRKPRLTSNAPPPVEEIAAELRSNRLAGSPSTMLTDQASSAIHWQPFTRETFGFAAKANRLVLAVVALPQQVDSCKVLKSIEGNPAMVRGINDRFVPVLIDAEACRESGLLASVLCSEMGRPLGIPLFIWLSPAGHPVRWLPVTTSEKGVCDLLEPSSAMVDLMWRESLSNPVVMGSSENQERAVRLSGFAKCPPAIEKPAEGTTQAIRKLASLYDRGSRSLDGCGALFPAGTLDLLGGASRSPGLPADVVSRCRETVRELTSDLSSSAMIDPLDGGIFSSRIGAGWSLPRFDRDAQSHARAITALISAYRANPEPGLKSQILAAVANAERTFGTGDGLFALGRQSDDPSEAWLWSVEDLEKQLTPDELKVLSAVSGLKGLGNIPIESDPQRQYFRRNSLSLTTGAAKAATGLGLSTEVATELLETARKKLLKIRQERIGSRDPDRAPHAGASFRMVSTYAGVYAITGDPSWRKKAVETLQMAKEAFSKGPSLQTHKGSSNELSSGRAFLYGLAIQAALDVEDITLDPALTSWAEDLASTASERFMDGDSLHETFKGQSPIDLPLTDRSMLFDDSSAGLLSSAHARLCQLGRTPPAAFSTAVVPLPTQAMAQPILFTDQLQAALIRHYAPLVLVSPTAPQELKDAVSSLPLRVISRRVATEADSVPPSSVKIVFKDLRSLTASRSAELLSALSPDGRP